MGLSKDTYLPDGAVAAAVSILRISSVRLRIEQTQLVSAEGCFCDDGIELQGA